ncbi:MAG: tetratricopeptide repeat protein [Gemmatimonadota bacterium]
MSNRSLFQELKRRRVFRATAAYVVVAFGLVEVANNTFPALELPPWTLKFVVVLAVLGLPVTIALSWAFDVRLAGVGRKPSTGDPATPDDDPASSAQANAVALREPPRPAHAADPGLAGRLADQSSVAVLPFTDLSADPEHGLFSDGVTEDVLAHLGKVKALRVTSRTSVLRYRETTKPVREIAAELGVRTVLEGSVRVVGDRVRIVAQLIDANSDTHLWAETYDRELHDIFAVQSDVAEAVARALEANLSGRELEQIHQQPTDDLQAYTLFLKGMAAFDSGLPDDYTRGRASLEAALRVDPDFARAHAGLALLLAATPSLTNRLPEDYHERLGTAASRALELDPLSGHAWLARHAWLWSARRDWLGAEEALQRARDLEPDDPYILLLGANYYWMLGRPNEAAGALDRLGSSGLQPAYMEVLRAEIDAVRADAGVIDSAAPLRRLDALVAREPAYGIGHLHRGLVLFATDRLPEALEAIETSLRLLPDVPLARGVRGSVLAHLGRVEEARAAEAWFDDEVGGASADPFCRALIPFALGEHDRAFDLVHQAVEGRTSFLLPFIRTMAVSRRFWDDPRFVAVMDAIWPGEQKRVFGPYGWQERQTAI